MHERVDAWLDPWNHVHTIGYQTAQGLYSIANGHFGGTGFGKGTFTDTAGNTLIPDLKTDMIFSALAQELGLIGISAFLLVYMVFALRGFRIAMIAEDGFSKLLAVGLTFGFVLQTFIIVGGVVRIIPLTGITLPFVSYGGSSIVANFVMLAGLLLVSEPRPVEGRVNDRIRRVAVVGIVLLAALDHRHDLLADVGAGRPRGAAGQRASSAWRSSRSTAATSTARDGEVAGAEPRPASRTATRSTCATTRPGKLVADVVGYSTQGRSRAGLERSLNDYLTGVELRPAHRARTRTLNSLEGKTVRGNSLVADAPARAAVPGAAGARRALAARSSRSTSRPARCS